MKHSVLIFSLTFVFLFKLSFIEAAERPNILFLYVDDMGWGAIGPNGQAERRAQNLPYVKTPNLNRLAAEGINFKRGYGCHVCSPARSSLQTGFHQGHTFADRNDPDNAKKAIRADDVSIGTMLSSAGYTTGYWGKWGYGGSKDQMNPVIENIQTLPTSHGYQHVLAELHHVRAHTFFQPTLWKAPAAPSAPGGLELVPNSLSRYLDLKNYPSTPALQNHPDYPETAYCDDYYALSALDFVRRQGTIYHETGQPFFGLLAVQIPHAPFNEITKLPDWDSAYKDDPHFLSLAEQSRQWAAMVTRIDAHFGNLLAALEDPNNDGSTDDSIADETLVIFQSDNGGPNGKNNVELDANGGLKGSKGRIQEGGIRVPLVMRWSKKIHKDSKLKSGSNCDKVVDVTDLLPTFCELAGGPAPVGIDGVSIAPYLTGQGRQRHRDFIIHEAGNGQSIIRDNFKLIRSKKSLTLFDLETDPHESNNIASKHPQLVDELEKLLLGERVTEPKGFANTYHQWVGPNNGRASLTKNWSDYKYSNAGKTYQLDNGPPQTSWVAKIANQTEQKQTVQVDRDLDLLAIEVLGKKQTQKLTIPKGVNLNGRNEIRLSDKSAIKLEGGSLSSMRWLDIGPESALSGDGIVESTIYNAGRLDARDFENHEIKLLGDYHQLSTGKLVLCLIDHRQPPFTISGRVSLNGALSLHLSGDLKLVSGQKITLIKAKEIEGTFINSNKSYRREDGKRFQIKHYPSKVVLEVE